MSSRMQVQRFPMQISSDLICYGGMFYLHGVENVLRIQRAKDGIKISNDATHRTILSVRRLV